MSFDRSLAVTRAEVRSFLLKEEPDAGDAEVQVRCVQGLQTAGEHSLVFAMGEAALKVALHSRAGVILIETTAGGIDPRLLRVKDPRQAFARVYERWFRPTVEAFLHPAATVETGAVLGAGCVIGAGAVVETSVRLGEGCRVGPNVVLHSGTTLGDRVRVQAGAILGSDGFGYVRTDEGYLEFPQIGTLEIGDDVEIGAGTTVDRGALGATKIGRGTKIDNLVHIAHNCEIGEDVLIAAQTGMAGSCVIGNLAILGGQVGLGERVRLGEEIILGSGAGVTSHKRLEGRGVVFWGTPARPLREYLKDLARARRS